MNFETIKKNNKTKIIIGLVVLLILTSVVMFVSTRAKYRSVQSLKLASGTVKLSSYDFKIMAMYQQKEDTDCTEDSCYDVLTGRMPSTGYVINEKKSYCTIDGKNKDEEAVLKTIDGHHVVENLVKNEKCYVWFDNKPTASQMLIASFENYYGYKGEIIPTFNTIATGGEREDNNGIYKVADGMYGGHSYYWRGAATSNHLIFNNMCWRIIRINGDGTFRIILNGTPTDNTCTGNGITNTSSAVLSGTKYNSSADNGSYVGWTYSVGNQRPSTENSQTSGTASTLKTATENWYDGNITASAKEKTAVGKFCNDRNTQDNASWIQGAKQYYAAYPRLFYATKEPTLDCPKGDVYELNAGAVTADELMLAGATGNSSAYNKSFYLYNGLSWWTMTPHSTNTDGNAWVLSMHSNGYIDQRQVDYTYLRVRPVINLRSDVIFNTGSDGTQNNPYIVQ